MAMDKKDEVAPASKKRRRKHRFLLYFAALFFVAIVAGVYVLDVPHWQSLNHQKLLKLAQTSRMYDQNGALVTTLRGRENRTIIRLSQIPVDVQNTFIAAEDLRFYQHSGFDLVRIFGSIWADIQTGKLEQGASTITQQLVKLTHLSEIKTFARKAEELFLAIQVETSYTKEQILEMYLNTIYFGNGAYGIQAAAEYYFNKSASELTVAEGAALAATIKAPSVYAPSADMKINETRRKYIIQTMITNGLISSEKGQEAMLTVISIAAQKPKEIVYGWYVDAAMEEAERILGVTPDDLLSGGYYIETALSPSLQKAVEDIYANKNNFPANASDGTPVQSAMAVTDVKTGALVAIVGGRNYYVQRGFNRAIHMRRQPGSSLKPLAVFAPAIEKGYTTASILLDERMDFGGGYNPRNSGNVYHGPVTARRALALSMNVATVRLMKDIGIGTAMNFLQRAGIPLTNTDANLSLALGAMTTGVTPAELAASYALFGNEGVYNAPYMISKIFAPDGSLLYQHAAAPRTVLNKQDNYLMVSMLQSVTSWGTGAKLSATGLAIGGKTGTVSLTGLSGNRDAWMTAFTSDYSLACWMGFDTTDNKHYLPSSVQGGGAPAAIATAFFKSAYRDKAKPSFKAPGGLVWLTIDSAASAANGKPLLASSYTPDNYKLSEVFLESNRPWNTSAMWQVPRAVSYFYIDYENSGQPKLVFGATDSANYRVERIRNGNAVVMTELYGKAGQTLTYTDWTAAAGEWYTYRVTPIHTGMLDAGVLLEGPSSTQSVQAKSASGIVLDGVRQWFINSGQ